MSFYKYFYCIITFIALHTYEVTTSENTNLDVIKTGVQVVTSCSSGLVLFADLNNTSPDVDFEVEVKPDQCCLDSDSNDDCDVMEIIGDCVDVIPKGTIKTIKMVAPLIDPLERHGYCIMYIDSKPLIRQRKAMRDTIKIPFDTRLNNAEQAMDLPDNIRKCNRKDEDPLNDCKPVDCDTYYNGKRSYYDKKSKRCTHIPACTSQSNEEVPKEIYDYKKNKCVVGDSLSDDDVHLIKELVGTNERKTKDILILKNTPVHLKALSFDEIKRNISKMVDSVSNKQIINSSKSKITTIKNKGLNLIMAKYFIANRFTLLIIALVISVQCCLICTMIYCLTKNCGQCQKKKVVRKFFNYRQDASVTTPLICTSNIDTETTEYQYFSESSNVDKKIKCYKACQKERKTNARMGMSDDILSKCLTRRDWNSKPVSSEAIAERDLVEQRLMYSLQKKDSKESEEHTSCYDTNVSSAAKIHSCKVNFENEEPMTDKIKPVKPINKPELKSKKGSANYNDLRCDYSEKEIKCHSYNYLGRNSKYTGFKPSRHDEKLGYSSVEKVKMDKRSLSTEKGAQAAFSNDSVDDFLFERGITYLAGENISKCSFSAQSNGIKASSLSSEVSSKASKNNVLKNVLSLLHRRSRHGSLSDTGTKKPDHNLDIELIHTRMSHASICTSSNNDSNYLKNLKKSKDSRTSL